jgi:prepilin-type processing-associated H-X9-DG protein
MKRSPAMARRGLTLLQLLVLLALLLFVLGLLVPFLARARAVAARSVSVNNLKQICLASHSFHDVNRQFPPAVGSIAGQQTPGTAHFFLLPYLEQANLYNQAEGSVWKNRTYAVAVPVFVSPKDTSAPASNRYQGWLATTNYAANWMVFKQGGMRIANIADGTSNTLMFAERYQVCRDNPCGWAYASLYYWAPVFGYFSYGKFQAAPGPDECNPALAQSLDPDGINAGFCDGSVRHIVPTVSPQTWWYLTDPSDGMVIGNDF